MSSNTFYFGEHLIIDAYKGDFKSLNDRELILGCLDELPDLLNMNKLSKPEIYFTSGNGIHDPGGWSGYVIITESHISIHTFPKRGFMSADIYTCKNKINNIDFIINYFKQKFKFINIKTKLLKRGTLYPLRDIY